MTNFNRREFLGSAAVVAGSAAIAHGAVTPSETVNVAVLGCGRGRSLARWFATVNHSQVVAICDVDESRGQKLCDLIQSIAHKRPEYVQDFRTLLDRKDVDALAVATPDHWHAPITIHACVAGKDVYVEKPCSHNIAEGRLAVTAARKHNRIVQHGTQLRAAPHHSEAWKLIKQGVIGKVLMVKAINNQRRGLLKHRNDQPVPTGVDYNLWLGPAKKRPFNKNRFHSGWHWMWDYGTGDIGNDGVHSNRSGPLGVGSQSSQCGLLQRCQARLQRRRPGNSRQYGGDLGIRRFVVRL